MSYVTCKGTEKCLFYFGSNEFSISIKESKKTAEVKTELTPVTEQKDLKPVTEEAPKPKNIFGQPTSVSSVLG